MTPRPDDDESDLREWAEEHRAWIEYEADLDESHSWIFRSLLRWLDGVDP